MSRHNVLNFGCLIHLRKGWS